MKHSLREKTKEKAHEAVWSVLPIMLIVLLFAIHNCTYSDRHTCTVSSRWDSGHWRNDILYDGSRTINDTDG